MQSLHTYKHDKLISHQAMHGCMHASFAPCTHPTIVIYTLSTASLILLCCCMFSCPACVKVGVGVWIPRSSFSTYTCRSGVTSALQLGLQFLALAAAAYVWATQKVVTHAPKADSNPVAEVGKMEKPSICYRQDDKPLM